VIQQLLLKNFKHILPSPLRASKLPSKKFNSQTRETIFNNFSISAKRANTYKFAPPILNNCRLKTTRPTNLSMIFIFLIFEIFSSTKRDKTCVQCGIASFTSDSVLSRIFLVRRPQVVVFLIIIIIHVC
jgi:hypothetical protein